jgi:lipoprotein-anchoring transpeptidase ErfK/SrfK
MLMWGGRNVGSARWLAVGAFTALSLPLAFVGANPELQSASSNVAATIAYEPIAPAAVLKQLPAEAKLISAPKASRRRKRIVVSIAERKLAVVDQQRVLKTYPIAVGAAVSPSPTGEFEIVNKVANPTYYRPGVVITPGELNPLGTRWLGLNREHYGIHGTNEPQSIGQAVSHGCIRMAQNDVEELYRLANIGDAVEISEQPLPQLAHLDSDTGNTDVR